MLALLPDCEALARLCRRHRIRRLSLFGSVLAGTACPNSDFDLLVEFAPAARPSLLDMAAIEAELSALLGAYRPSACLRQGLPARLPAVGPLEANSLVAYRPSGFARSPGGMSAQLTGAYFRRIPPGAESA